MSEQSSPARVSGKMFLEVAVSGKKYPLTEPQRIGYMADEVSFILSLRLDPLAFALRACAVSSPLMHSAIWQGCSATASNGIPTAEERAAYELSAWKWAFMFWKTLSPEHPQKKSKNLRDPSVNIEGVRWAYEIVSPLEKNEPEFKALMYAIGIVSQDNDLKNWFGPSKDSGTPTTDTHSTEDQQPSTPGSENDTQE